jgi:predicted nicotinamide N-methyase
MLNDELIVLQDAYFGEILGEKSVYQLTAAEFQSQCLSSNRSAGDSTGLRTYSGAQVAVRHLVKHSELIESANVVELGSGTGVFGLLGCSKGNVRRLVLTDGEERACQVINKNIEYINATTPDQIRQTSSAVLKWGNVLSITEVLQMLNEQDIQSDKSLHFDVVLGCELMYFNTEVNVLVDTVMALTGGRGLFVHTHLFRAPDQEQTLIDYLSRFGWTTLETPVEDFILNEELQHHIEWRRMRPLVSGPRETMEKLALTYPTWRVFQEEITYPADEEDDDDVEGGGKESLVLPGHLFN